MQNQNFFEFDLNCKVPNFASNLLNVCS